MIKNWLKKVTGLDQLETIVTSLKEKTEELEEKKAQLEQAVAKEEEKALLASMTPKERATAKGEPWVNVLDVKVNKDNVRNGFFELDWNDAFILELKQFGYGADGDPDEEIVDRWFRDIVTNMFAEEGLDTDRNSGYINVVPISRGKSEVS